MLQQYVVILNAHSEIFNNRSAFSARWEACEDIEYIKWVQANTDEVPKSAQEQIYSDDEDEDSSEDDHGGSGSKEESSSDDDNYLENDAKFKNRFEVLDATSSD